MEVVESPDIMILRLYPPFNCLQCAQNRCVQHRLGASHWVELWRPLASSLLLAGYDPRSSRLRLLPMTP